MQLRIFALGMFVISLAACDVTSTLVEGSKQARAVESWPEEGFEGHRYLARLRFERAGIARIQLDYLRPDGELILMRASLHDEVSNNSAAVDPSILPATRWGRLGTFP